MLLHSSYGITSNTKISLENITKLINEAYEERLDNRAWQVWANLYPNMGNENFISFTEFKKKFYKRGNYTKKSFSDIEKEMNKVIQAYERQVKK